MSLSINPRSSIDRAIRALERIFHINIRYLAGGTAWLSIGRIASIGISFVLSILYARYLTKEVYGEYRFILGLFGALGIFALPGMATSVVRSVARGYLGTFRRSVTIITTSAIGIVIGGIFIAAFYAFQGNMRIASGALLLALFMPAIEGFGIWRGFYDGLQQFRKKTLRNLVSHGVYAATMITAVLYVAVARPKPTYTLLLLIGAYAISQSITNTYFLRETIRNTPKDSQTEPGSIRYGLHASIATIPSTIAYNFDTILLHTVLGPAALAVYAFAIALPEQLKSFINSVADVAFPKLSKKMADEQGTMELRHTLFPRLIKIFFLTAIIVLSYVALTPVIYTYLFPRYIDSIAYSQIFALSLLFLPLSILDKTLKAEGKLWKIYTYNALAPWIQILALALLIPPFGLWGAIAGRIIGRLTNYAFLVILFIV